MNRTEAVALVEGFGSREIVLDRVKQYFESELKSGTKDDHEKRGEDYYYLLKVLIKKHVMLDNPITHQYFDHMTKEFLLQEEVLLDAIRLPSDVRNMKMKLTQLKAFYKLMERYYVSLETDFANHGFVDFRDKAFLEKMKTRTKRYKVQGEWAKYVAYSFFEITTLYGTSLMRWCIFTVVLLLVFAVCYYFSDLMGHTSLVSGPVGYFRLEYLLLSVQQFMLSGQQFSFSPTIFQQFLLMFELGSGYVMFGLFITLLSRRLY